MTTVILGKNKIQLQGEMPKVGDKAPDFSLTLADMSTAKLSDFQGTDIVVCSIPSIDTPVCATETRKFNEGLAQRDNIQVLMASKDLPFAFKRYCGAEGLDHVKTGSDFRSGNFSRDYGVEMADGPLAGLCARAVFLIDKTGTIKYQELVPEIGAEPDYEKLSAAIDQL